MIDEKWLDDALVDAKAAKQPLYAFDNEQAKEILRLARLGIWARDYGIPNLEWANTHLEGMDNYSVVAGARHIIGEALRHLPKETK